MDVEIHRIPLVPAGAGAAATPEGARTPATSAESTPVDDPRLTRLLSAWNEIGRGWVLEAYGTDDFVQPVDVVRTQLANQRYTAKASWVAVPARTDPDSLEPAAALARADLRLPLSDNTHLVEVNVIVRREHRGQGIGSAFVEVLREELRGSGRTTIGAWSPHPSVPAEHPNALAAKNGAGVIDRTDPTAAWLLRLGFEFEMGDRYSVLRIPDDRASWLSGVVAEHRARAADRAGTDYALVHWDGPTPPEWRERMAVLRNRMSVDAPMAGLDYREEAWDIERVIHHDEQVLARCHASLTTAIRHVPTGELVAYTDLQWPHHRPEAVYQEDTLVHGEHRGHRLGMLAKAANLEYLLAANPRAARIHTWNAEENRFMLDINEALCFRPAAVEGAWQKVVDPLWR